LVNQAKNFKIKNILLGHHLDDLYENFFIRILRGSGLNGLISMDKKTQSENINLIRPLLNFEKKDLIYISNYIFGSYVKDPTNVDYKFKRARIRNFLKELEIEGLDKNKFLLTISNLKFANETIKFYTKKNLEENTYFIKNKKLVFLKEKFFYQSEEVVFRSFTEVIKFIGKKYYPARGKKIDKIIQLIENSDTLKTTLGGCIVKKVNQTIMVSKEQ
jgi:tRNA(Ile)-lysidine synthase